MGRLTVRCSSEGCSLPWATITGGSLVVVSRHNGAKHINVLSLRSLLKLMAASAQLSADELEEYVSVLRQFGVEHEHPPTVSDPAMRDLVESN